MEPAYIAVLISVGCTVLFSTLAYLLSQRDKQREKDISNLETLIKETATLVLAEKDKTAALVISEKDKVAAAVKAEYDKLDEKFTLFRIKVAEEYTTTTLLEKITKPLLEKLTEIEQMLHTKMDRRDFEEYKKYIARSDQK